MSFGNLAQTHQIEVIHLSNIISISTGIPIEFKAIQQKTKAEDVRNTVTEVGNRMQVFDQVETVDLNSKKGSVDVSDAKLPPQGLTGKILSAVVPEKVSGFAEFSDDGKMESLYTASQDISGKKELQYARNDDGSQTYAVITPTGQTVVRESTDGTLFMMESPQADAAAWDTMSSPNFQAPIQNPEDRPRTIDDAKKDYQSGVERRADLIGGLFSEETRGKALDGLKKELFRWNPFS